MIGKIERKLTAYSMIHENELKKRHEVIKEALEKGIAVYRSFSLGNGDINKFILEHPDFVFQFRKLHYHKPQKGSYTLLDKNIYIDVLEQKPISDGVYVVETEKSVSPSYVLYERETYSFIIELEDLRSHLKRIYRDEKINQITNDTLQ